MKKIKGLVLALLGAVLLSVAAMPASAQGWNRNRISPPRNAYEAGARDNRTRSSLDRDRRNRDNRAWQDRGWNDSTVVVRDRDDFGRNNRQRQSFTIQFGRNNHQDRSYRRH